MIQPEEHHTLANSIWTRNFLRKSRDQVGMIYPPVPPFDAGRPWRDREDRVVWLGRWHWLKRMDLAIDLVQEARLKGATTLRLAFAGFWHGSEEEWIRLRKRCQDLDWVEWHESLDRDALQKLVGSSRYGLHTMLEEHFGIAVAEMMTAGCVVLVHDSGGPPEIVQERRQAYRDTQEGGKVLYEIWNSPTLQQELHSAARPRGLSFSPERFSSALIEEIKSFETANRFS